MKIEDHLIFTAKHGGWRVARKLTKMENEGIAHFLAAVSNSVNSKIPLYFGDKVDVKALAELAEDLRKDNLSDTIIALKSPGTSRKLGGLIREDNKKLKKLLVDATRAVLVRMTLKGMVPVDYPEGELQGVEIQFPYEKDHVNFTAKHGKWIVVKRLIIDEKTPSLDIARLLASINETVTLKLPLYAGIDVEGIKREFSEFKKVKKSDIPMVIEVYTRLEPSRYAAEPFVEYARVYGLRIALEKIGLPIDVPSKSLEKYLEKV